mgnify:FL=1
MSEFRDLLFPNPGEALKGANFYRSNKRLAYKKGYEEFCKSALPVTISGRQYRSHPNINLYIDMTSACDSDCLFCIAKVKFSRAGRPVKPEWLSQALTICAPMAPSVQITGGEPTLFPNHLKSLLDVLEKSHPRRPVLNTNGAKLLQINGLLKTSVLEHINISRHHYNEVRNAKILVRGGVSNDTLRSGIEGLQHKIRIQCNLLAGEIDTYGEVMQFIAYCYHTLGVTTIAFAQLTSLPSYSFYADSIMAETQNSPVNVDAILREVEQDSCFELVKYKGGVACYYEVWRYVAYEKPVTVIFKYSDNAWLEKADADQELLPDLVLHTDGTLAGSWCKTRKVLAKFS